MTRTLLCCLWLACLLGAAPARAATLEVEVEGVEGALRENVLAFLSLQRHARSEALDEDMVGRLVQRAEREVAAALRPFGYYEPAVATELSAIEDGWRARVRVEPGPPVLLAGQTLKIEGSGKDQPFLQQALARSRLVDGERLSHAAYDQLKGELLRSAASHGYLDAEFSESELRVDPGARQAWAILTLQTGERYRFGQTRIEQSFLEPGFVERYLRYREGDWYDAGALLLTQFALDDSGYFAVVEVLPEERDRAARTAPVRVRSEPGKRNAWTAAVGYASDTRWRGTLGWENRRLNASGHRMLAELRGSDIEESIRLAYVIPWTDPALEKLSLELRGLREQRADIDSSGSSFKVALTQVRGNWQRVLSLTADATRDEIVTMTGGMASVTRRDAKLLVPGISYALMPAGFLGTHAVPHGFYAELSGSSSALGSDTEFLRLVLRDERRYRLSGHWRLLLRGELGTSLVGDFQELPSQYRFFAGGDRSVRGYAYEELSPVDADGNRIGGKHLLVASVELQRELPRNWVVAAFFDAGNAFDDFGDSLEYSAGLGLRYRLPFLSIGLDVATSLSEPGRRPRIHLNFTPEF